MHCFSYSQEILSAGLREDDPRLRSIVRALKPLPEKLTSEQFVGFVFLPLLKRSAVGPAAGLLRKALAGEFIIPDFEAFCQEFDLTFHQVCTGAFSLTTRRAGLSSAAQRLRAGGIYLCRVEEYEVCDTDLTGSRHSGELRCAQ